MPEPLHTPLLGARREERYSPRKAGGGELPLPDKVVAVGAEYTRFGDKWGGEVGAGGKGSSTDLGGKGSVKHSGSSTPDSLTLPTSTPALSRHDSEAGLKAVSNTNSAFRGTPSAPPAPAPARPASRFSWFGGGGGQAAATAAPSVAAAATATAPCATAATASSLDSGTVRVIVDGLGGAAAPATAAAPAPAIAALPAISSSAATSPAAPASSR